MLINPPEKKFFKKKKSLVYQGQIVDLSVPLVMGILNITPDSFYDGGKFQSLDVAVQRAIEMHAQGAAIIDIGAYSSRPNAQEVSIEEELKRLLPVVVKVKRALPDALISIDTYRAKVAERVIGECGDCMINDIGGGTLDPKMFETVARLKVPYVLMHIQGTPQSMQKNPDYSNVTKEVIKQLSEGVSRLHELGINDVIIDPGFGFGKTLQHNYELFNHLDAFRFFELPVLVGISRKSMIYGLFNSSADESLNGTTVLNTLALQSGANILRVHDVKEAVECIAIQQKLKEFAT